MIVFEIWSEGFHIMQEKAQASLVARVEANSFREACIKHYKDNISFNEQRLTHWGCQLFDNKQDAQKNFG